MTLPKISVVTVTYNSEDTLERTIRSVINQDYPNKEYIVIDGNSTDNTVSIINKYERHIAYCVTEKDEGVYDAMNKGILASTGDIIHLLNSDDEYADDQVLTRVAEEIGKFQLLSAKVEYRMNTRSKVLYMEESAPTTAPHPGLFVRKSYYENNLYNTEYKYAADRDFLSKIKDHSIIKPASFVSTIMNAGGLSTSYEAAMESCYVALKHGHVKTSVVRFSKFFLKKLIQYNP